MPHTSHKRSKQHAKRIEVTNDDGWTRVTSTDTAQRTPRASPAQKDLEQQNLASGGQYQGGSEVPPSPANTTLKKLEDQYRKIEHRWLASSSHQTLEKILREDIDTQVLKTIDKCVVFGTGSFCGSSSHRVARVEVSMYQLAAFVSAIAVLGTITGSRPVACAQEPEYNGLDIDLLSRLQITVVQSPAGFSSVTPSSFVYAPNAELSVELQTLSRTPAIAMLHGKLEDFWRNAKGEACTNRMLHSVQSATAENRGLGSCRSVTLRSETDDKRLGHGSTYEEDEIEQGLVICERFKQDKERRRLPSLDAKDQPFFDVHIFYGHALEDDNG